MQEIIEGLKKGGTVLYPSDTIWGLGCDATNEEACQKLVSLKNRPEEKSFILLVDSFQMIDRFIPEYHEICYDLADLAVKPMTIIYPNAKGLAPSVVAEDGSIGIRITQDANCLKMIRGMRKPLVSTSANLSGQPSPTCYDAIDASIKKNVDFILKERLTEKMITPSQIIKIGVNGDVKVLRK